MTFLQPMLLWALPVIALPIIIHLISRRRHRVMPWAAMMFLLDAQRASRGMARLRQWLILALRVLALLLLIVGAGRPLLSAGARWLGGSLDTIFIVLDRSASMEQLDPDGGISKRSAALRRIAEYVERVGRVERLVLVDSGTGEAMELDGIQGIERIAQTQPTDAAADIPALLQQVAAKIDRDHIGGGEVWILSDARQSDWDPAGGRWESIRRRFSRMPQLAVRLVAFDRPARRDFAIRVTRAEIEAVEQGARRLVIDFTVTRRGTDTEVAQLPVTIEVGGVQTSHTVTCREAEQTVRGFPIPLDASIKEGWGVVSIPSDDQPANNRCYFTFAQPVARRTVIVCEDRSVGRYFEQAAATPNLRGVTYEADVLGADQAETMDLEHASLLVWQAPLPTGNVARRIASFAREGRAVLFLPPTDSSSSSQPFGGLAWESWRDSPRKQRGGSRVEQWQTDSGPLAHDQSGRPLTVADLRLLRWRGITGSQVVAARLDTHDPLLVRSAAPHAATVWFLATLPRASDSNLAEERIVSYVLIHRLIEQGARAASTARRWDAGSDQSAVLADAERIAAPPGRTISAPRTAVAGIVRHKSYWIALNRPPSEDAIEIVDRARLARLFDGCNFRAIDGRAGEDRSLAREVWRTALLAMLLALVAEGLLSIPGRPAATAAQAATRPAERREAA